MKDSTKIMLAAASGAAALTTLRLLTREVPFSFRNKAVFITGGSRGLGLRMARVFAEEGARLALIGRDKETLENAVRDLADTGAQVVTIACDVRDRKQVQEAIEASVKQYGAIDVLVNNAGVIQVGPVEEMKIEDFESAMATHFWGPLYTTFAALPHMRREGGGRIVNISSIGGKIAVPHLMPYSASKFALAGLSDAMRAELRSYGILVTSVYPGLMRTGSDIAAHTKGREKSEFAWFSFMARSRLFSIDPTRAARQIVEACRAGRSELVITPQANLAAMVQGVAPSVVATVSAWVDRLLPAPKTPIEKTAA